MPVRTISLVSGSCCRWTVLSSSVILWSAPESFVSSPRVLGVTARPTIGVGNLSGGSSTSPSDMPVWSSSFLATATMSPGPASSTLAVLSACTESSGPILMPLRCPATATVAVLLERAGINADEAQPLHERIDPRLEDLRGERRGRIGLERHRVAILRGGARRRPSAAANTATSTASSSSTPTPAFVETQTIGVSVPLPDRLGRRADRPLPSTASRLRSISPSPFRRPR